MKNVNLTFLFTYFYSGVQGIANAGVLHRIRTVTFFLGKTTFQPLDWDSEQID